MKNFNLFAAVVSLTLVFTSCSFNETVLPEEQSTDLLKTHTIKRDVDGTYSLDYSLNANAATENVVDESTNTNYIYLYSAENKLSSKVTQDFTIDGNQLKIGFVDTNSSKKSQITIKDEDAKFFKTKNEDMLSEYSISGNEDGTYTLNFSVNNKVKVDFVFNEELNIYEVHLEEGKSDETTFSKVFDKIDGEALKIDFVNHIREDDNISAKSNGEDDGYVFTKERRPEVIII
ncbi:MULTISPECIES: hypothetical protein [Polaribacter]|uniref:Lipoprotein n=1 Tax=Polaribacter sejongensis TaxID=985043 RepID=A0ABN5F4C1_9FLAO|nr:MULTISPECIES: hypothetical protein [Polaribacter]AUC20982.1 hypothetical protein BTO15_02105 [Polaribacter sejongensis]